MKKDKLLNEMKEIENKNFAEKIISDTEIEFSYENKKYRVSKPNHSQKKEAYEFKGKKYIELLKDDNYTLEEDLKEIYKKRGIDIDAIDGKIRLLVSEKEKHQYKLGELIEKKGNKKDLELYKLEIEKINSDIGKLSQDKSNKLEFSLESQLTVDVYSYLISLIAEKKVDNKWVKVWKTYKNFEQEKDDKLVNVITFYGCLLIKTEV